MLFIYMMSTGQLNSYIEHTALKPDLTIAEVQQLCNEAMQFHFAGVCVPVYFLNAAIEILNGTGVDIVTVIGFPYGYSSTISKFEEAEEALFRGADHLDVVINIAAVKNNDWETVENEIETLTKLVHAENKVIKLIAETGMMSDIELDLICKIANDSKVDYLKSSTGVNGPGANVETIAGIREMLSPDILIKASGGIRTRSLALELIEAGANRIGASKSVAMVTES